MARPTRRARTAVYPARRIIKTKASRGNPSRIVSTLILPAAQPAAPGVHVTLEAPIEFDETQFAPPAANTPPNAEPDHILLKSEMGKPIRVLVPLSEDTVYTDEVDLVLNGKVIETQVVAEGEGLDPRPFAIKPTESFLPTLNVLNYVLRYVSGGSNSDEGPGDFFNIDTVAPGGDHELAAPEVDSDIVDGGLTKDKLVTLPDGKTSGLAIRIPSYEGFNYGDKIRGIVDDEIDTFEAEVPFGHTGKIDAGVTEALIAKAGDGRVAFKYKITDRAGNESQPSNALWLQVALKGAENLEAVQVPAYDDDDDSDGGTQLIDLADATNKDGVAVVIPWSDDFQPGDTLALFWGNSPVTPYTLTAGDADAEDDITIGVMFPAIYEEWTYTAKDDDQIVPADVLYHLKRGNIDLGTSPRKTVDVNVYQVGGGDPDPEEPGNQNLQWPSLVAASGARDKVEGDDFGKKATVQIAKQTRHTTPKNVFAEDDVVSVLYNGTEFASHTIVAADLVDTSVPLVVDMAADVITDVGSGTIDLQYSITRAVEGGENTTFSPIRGVVVAGKDQLPGDGKELDAPLCPESEDTWMYVDKVNDGTLLALPLWTRFNAENQEVLVSFKYFSGRDQSPIPGRDFEMRLTAPLTVSPAETLPVKEPDGNERPPVETDYIGVRIPRERLMYLSPENRFFYIEASYEVNNTAGDTTPVASATTTIKVDTRGS
ncbi:hypothetical protein [Luteibacter yeojuensis]|uniref:Uncharacterized protein n=1 Tax=Luteibacter yeojuensis TaxID=345309 RepID=A0A0F3K172_9GAMM|nr:hypothetical protein [Luteibacter yeojuensis]KJV24943.1 hypothetical protein VI08_20075 [Luteibacter yeojuensis]